MKKENTHASMRGMQLKISSELTIKGYNTYVIFNNENRHFKIVASI